MREIIFRGKEKSTNKWIYGDLIHKAAMPEINVKEEICIGGHVVIPETVGQYIGRIDENNKEMYEGDIIEVTSDKSSSEYIGKIIYICCQFAINTRYSNRGIINQNYIQHGNCSYWETFTYKVIGNIFDNPELLK